MSVLTALVVASPREDLRQARRDRARVHIALITHHYEPEVGAPQRRWGALVPRFIEAGHTVSVLAPSPHYPSGVAVGLTRDERPGATSVGAHGEQIYRLMFRDHGLDLVSRTVDQAIAATDAVIRGLRELGPRGRRPDVIIATVPGMPSIGAGVVLSRCLRVPLVVEMRDAWPDLIAPSDVWAGSKRRRLGWRGALTTVTHRAMTQLQRAAAAIVTTTDSFADVLQDRRMPQVEVVRNGASLEEIPRLGARSSGDPELRVLYLGTVGRSQGLAAAVRASAMLKAQHVPFELRIVGSGAEMLYLIRLARSIGAPVTFFDRVPECDVVDHFRWADSLLVSLRDWEPLRWTVPSKLYESLATGRHVTGVLAGEAAAILRTTGAGHVVAPEDPVGLAELWARLANNRELLKVDNGGRDWAFNNSGFDLLAAHYLAILKGVTA